MSVLLASCTKVAVSPLSLSLQLSREHSDSEDCSFYKTHPSNAWLSQVKTSPPIKITETGVVTFVISDPIKYKQTKNGCRNEKHKHFTIMPNILLFRLVCKYISIIRNVIRLMFVFQSQFVNQL